MAAFEGHWLNKTATHLKPLSKRDSQREISIGKHLKGKFEGIEIVCDDPTPHFSSPFQKMRNPGCMTGVNRLCTHRNRTGHHFYFTYLPCTSPILLSQVGDRFLIMLFEGASGII